MERQAIKPELTTRELYDIFHLHRTIPVGVSIVLYDTEELHINYHLPEHELKDSAMPEIHKSRIKMWISQLIETHTLPPFESNFIDRSQL